MNMRKVFALTILLISLLLTSCKDEFEEIDVSAFKNYGVAPLVHTIYFGSDEKYHYFVWSKGKTGGKWKVALNSMQFNCTFPFDGSTHRMIIKYEAGHAELSWCKSI